MTFNNDFTEESLITDIDSVLNKLSDLLSHAPNEYFKYTLVQCIDTLESIQIDLIDDEQ